MGELGNGIAGLIVTLAAMAGAYGLALAFIKNTGIKKKRLEKVEADYAQIKQKSDEQTKDIDELKRRCEKNESNFQDLMMFQIGRK